MPLFLLLFFVFPLKDEGSGEVGKRGSMVDPLGTKLMLYTHSIHNLLLTALALNSRQAGAQYIYRGIIISELV